MTGTLESTSSSASSSCYAITTSAALPEASITVEVPQKGVPDVASTSWFRFNLLGSLAPPCIYYAHTSPPYMADMTQETMQSEGNVVLIVVDRCVPEGHYHGT